MRPYGNNWANATFRVLRIAEGISPCLTAPIIYPGCFITNVIPLAGDITDLFQDAGKIFNMFLDEMKVLQTCGLNADTLLKRGIFDDLVSNAKSNLEHAEDVFKNFSVVAQEHIKADEQKVAERINATKDFFKGLQQEISNKLHRNSTTQKRSPLFFDRPMKKQRGFINLAELYGKRSPLFFDNSPKRSILGDLFNKTKQYAEKLEHDAQQRKAQIDAFIKELIDNIFHRNASSNSTSKRSLLGDFFNKTKEYAEQVKEKLDKAAEERKEKFEEFLNKIKERFGQNSTASKRSISFDTGLTIINDLRSKLDAAVQNVKQYLSNNANSSILDNLKNIASGIVNTKFNLTEISADVSECVQAEESNVTNAVQQARSQLEAIVSKEEQAAEPFLQNVSVTAPKVANLIFEASANASSCGQNYICLAVVAFNAYNEAVVLEPEVVQEIQAGVALAKSLAADAKVISEQILAPAFSGVIAISQETISCIEGKLSA
ncbi:hypothetical protein C0J52_11246 [Blattella germanica]|nr:hypothetical protein C0J52_11246 [Blattella germanica]